MVLQHLCLSRYIYLYMSIYIGWCTNSVINLQRSNSASNWNIPNAKIVLDIKGLPLYQLNQNNISIYYNTTGSFSVGVGASLVLQDYLPVTQPRVVPQSIDVSSADSQCSFNLRITANYGNGSPDTSEQYFWTILDNAKNKEILPETNTFGQDFLYPLGNSSYAYSNISIRLRTYSSCCGFSYPIYKSNLSPIDIPRINFQLISRTGKDQTYCSNEPGVSITGYPNDPNLNGGRGSFTSSPVAAAVSLDSRGWLFDPATAGLGNHNIAYSVCIDS